MRIVEVKAVRGKRGKVRIAFDGGEEALVLSGEVAARSGLVEGAEIDAGRLEAAVREDARMRCRERAWGLLARRPRTRTELRRALARGGKFSPELIDETLAHLEEIGYLDDRQYARQAVEQARSSGRAGPNLVRQQLAARGIAREVAEEELEPLREDNTQEVAARALLEKWNRRPRPTDPRKRREAAAAFLLRRGFEPDVAWETVRAVLGENSEPGDGS